MTLTLLIGSETQDDLTLEEYKQQVEALLDLLLTDFKAIKGRSGSTDDYKGLTPQQVRNITQMGGRAQIGTDRINAFKEASST
jgi:hypothetical protein